MATIQWVAVLASLMPLGGCSNSQAGERTVWVPVDTAPLLLPDTATAIRYYVAVDGADANPGSAAAPFRTIQKAADVASAGDTVIVRPGIYSGGDRIVSL